MRATHTSALLALVASVSAQGYYESAPTDGTSLTGIRGINSNAAQTTAASLAACENICSTTPVDIGDGVTQPCVLAIFTPSAGACITFAALDTADGNVVTGAPLDAGSIIALRYGLPNSLADAPSAICDPAQGDAGSYAPDLTATTATDKLVCSCGRGRINYSNVNGNASDLVCLAAAVVPTTTTTTTTTTAPPTTTTTTSTSTTTTTTTSIAAVNPNPQISAGKRRRIRQAAFAF